MEGLRPQGSSRLSAIGEDIGGRADDPEAAFVQSGGHGGHLQAGRGRRSRLAPNGRFKAGWPGPALRPQIRIRQTTTAEQVE